MTKRKKRVGITGGIGSGKSTVCAVFRLLGIPIYDSDARAKHLMATDAALISALRNLLGTEAYNSEGHWNRAFFAKKILNEPETAQSIEAIVHPAVAKDFEVWASSQPTNVPFLLREAALMIEANATKGLDALIVVLADESVRLRRVLERDPHRTQADVELIFKKQLSDSAKIQHATHLIRNDHSEMLLPQIIRVFNHIQQGES